MDQTSESILVDENFNLHARLIPSMTHGMKVFHADGIAWVDSGLDCDTFNIIHITDGEKISRQDLSRALGHFTEKGMAFCLWTNERNLTPRVEQWLRGFSLSRQIEEIGMVLELSSYQVSQRYSHANILIAKTQGEISTFASVLANNWSPPDLNVHTYYQSTHSHFLNPDLNISLMVNFSGKQGVSTLEMFPTDRETVGIYGFATLESSRGQGIGSALMEFALNKAKEWGYKRVILQATEDGIGIYRKMGFQEISKYYEYG